jgi:hypothetical protein
MTMSLLAAGNVSPLLPNLGMAQNYQRKRSGDLAVQAKNHMLQFHVCPILALTDLTFLVLCPHEPARAKSDKRTFCGRGPPSLLQMQRLGG